MNSTNEDQNNASINEPPVQKDAPKKPSAQRTLASGAFDLAALKKLLETNYAMEAKTLMRSYLATPDRKSDILFHAAELFLKHEISDMAEVTYKAILEQDKNNVPVLGRLGDIVQKRGDNRSAINYFRQIIKHDLVPQNWVYIGLGNALERIGEIDEAVNFFNKAMKTGEFKPELSIRIENLKNKQKLIEEGVLDAEDKIDREPNNPYIHGDIGNFAVGYLEAGAASTRTEEGVVVGWLKYASDVTVWLENNHGERISLNNAFRFNRQDVDDLYGNSFGYVRGDAGFIIRIAGIKPGEIIRLVGSYMDSTFILSETVCDKIGGAPIAVARWLFGLASPISQMKDRFQNIDIPMIDAFLRFEQKIQAELPVKVHQLGLPLEVPLVSVIIPLYGRVDFVESQLLEFFRDTWFQEHAEIIYVLDDPKLIETFLPLAETLYRLYNLPFKWISSSVNRGFSGANNLGVSNARGKYLLFLNSDVFPQQPGWLESLLEVLDTHPKIGAVGPRLVFANGSIQHAGMSFMRREEFGIWVNHHPYMGLDPSLDPAQELTIVPAVTGACLAMRRVDFNLIGGWDTGYLIGDFEDSDLCLKLHSEGFDIAYLPTVQLTHLERQSFRLLGQDDFRFRVVIYNAVRHQTRWQPLIEELANHND